MDKELISKLNSLMLELEGKERITDFQCRELFNIHNEIYPDIKEWTMGCSSCRERVHNRMKDFWNNNKGLL